MSIELVKKLREVSGIGMLDCQKALKEADGDFDKAIELLRKRGEQIVNKTTDRVANEGIIVFASSDDAKKGAMIEINCETDFVARNEDFIAYAKNVANIIASSEVNTLEEAMALVSDGKTLQEMQNEMVGKIKEKIQLRRFKRVTTSGIVSAYVHFDGKSGCLIEVSPCEKSDSAIATVRDLGMHSVALKPNYLNVSDIPADTLQKEKEILMAQPDMLSKPAEIVEKIVQGRINKYYSENCLNEQLFIKDDSKTVKEVVSSLAAGTVIKEFAFYELGI